MGSPPEIGWPRSVSGELRLGSNIYGHMHMHIHMHIYIYIYVYRHTHLAIYIYIYIYIHSRIITKAHARSLFVFFSLHMVYHTFSKAATEQANNRLKNT